MREKSEPEKLEEIAGTFQKLEGINLPSEGEMRVQANLREILRGRVT